MGNARLSVSRALVASSACVNFARTLLATNIPGSLDSSAVLALSKSNTTAARLELESCIETLIVGRHFSDWASLKASRAQCGHARLV